MEKVYWKYSEDTKTGGKLDLDFNNMKCEEGKPIENIIYHRDAENAWPGKYMIIVDFMERRDMELPEPTRFGLDIQVMDQHMSYCNEVVNF